MAPSALPIPAAVYYLVMNHRDPNQGSCTNACRWKYQAHDAKETDTGNIIPIDAIEFDPRSNQQSNPALGIGKPSNEVVLLQEGNRENDLMPMFEDEHGTYIMNSKDLRAIQHVQRLQQMGIHSLKIEGRTKSHYYAARTSQAYRQAIDDAANGKIFDMNLMTTLENMSNRGFTEGFYRRHVHDEYQNYNRGASISTQQQFVGEVTRFDELWLTIDVKNRFQLGDELELMTPQGNVIFELKTIQSLKGESRLDAPGSGFIVQIPRPKNMVTGDKALLIRNLK